MVLSISHQHRCGADTVLVLYIWGYLVGENTDGTVPKPTISISHE